MEIQISVQVGPGENVDEVALIMKLKDLGFYENAADGDGRHWLFFKGSATSDEVASMMSCLSLSG
ncbi:MAG: hypothetical protein ACFCUT_06850 [Kiloniellaceae bacterium]